MRQPLQALQLLSKRFPDPKVRAFAVRCLDALSDADLAALGAENACQFRLTEVAFPSFVHDGDGQGAIKINGKLIPVMSNGPGSYASGELRIRTRPLDDRGTAGLQMQEMIVVAPRAKDEFGFWGYTTCDSDET